MLDRAIPREHCAVRTAAGAGIVTSGTYSPTLKVGIAMALLPPSVEAGDPVNVEIRGRERAGRRGGTAVLQPLLEGQCGRQLESWRFQSDPAGRPDVSGRSPIHARA